MEYMTREELVRLFKVARKQNPLHHVAMLVGLLHGLRVSETLAIRGRDICDGKLSVKRLKKSRATLHALRIDRDVLFDESPLLDLATANPDTELFPWSRQYMDVVIKRYSALAGIHPAKRHYHVLKHSICVLLWQETHDLNAIQDHVGHRSSSSTLVYLRADAAQKAQSTIAEMSFNNGGRSLAHGDAERKVKATITYGRRELLSEGAI
jgi:site-specific recombinase XerD